MTMMSIMLKLLLFGDGLIMLWLYHSHVRTATERWKQGCGLQPNVSRIRKDYLLIWVVLQVIKVYWILGIGTIPFPAQR